MTVLLFSIEPNDNFFNNNISFAVDIVIENFIVTREDILQSIRKLNMSKAPGPDGIHARVIIEYIDIFYLFSKNLDEGVLPYQLKQANVKALFKKDSRSVLEQDILV